MELSPSRAFWAGGNPTRHPGHREELRLRPGTTGSLSRSAQSPPRTPSRLGSGDVAAVVVDAAEMPSGSRAPGSARRPHSPALPCDHPAATTSRLSGLLHEYV